METHKGRLFEFLTLILFLGCGALGILTHEFWRDEAAPWLAIRSSQSIHDLISNLGYTGHTLTFFIWQYELFQFFRTPVAGSVANLLFMAAAIWMFVRTSPFTKIQKWLFAFGFYPLYQYAIFNRMYAFLVFFIFSYCTLYLTKPKRTLLRWLMLIAMAETHVIGMLVAIPLAFLDLFRNWKEETSSKTEKILCSLKLSFFIFAITSVVWQIWPADRTYHSLHPATPLLFIVGLADAFLPNYGILFDSQIQIALGTFLFGIATATLWRHRIAFINFTLTCTPLILFSAIIYLGHRWHHGFYWIYWVISIWLAGDDCIKDKRVNKLITLLFAIQTIIGIYALIDDGLHPYSGGKALAHHIQSTSLSKMPIVGAEVFQDQHAIVYKWEVDQIQPTLMEIKDSKIYNPKTNEWINYWNHYDSKLYFSRQSLLEFERSLFALSKKIPPPFLVIVALEHGLTAPQMPNGMTLEAEFGSISDYGEHLALYLYSPTPQ